LRWLAIWGRFEFVEELKKVQILRFVELCEQYGYREGSSGEMAPIDEWETDDREELIELLDIAASRRPSSKVWPERFTK
jgi:hypothetical protein